MQGGFMKPVIIFCVCGRVKKFGEWIIPTPGQLSAMNNGTYQRNYETCKPCNLKTEINRSMFPANILR
jgi:hypothetical protein